MIPDTRADLVFAGYAGLAGTEWIVSLCRAVLAEHFPSSYLKEIEAACLQNSVIGSRTADILSSFTESCTAVFPASENDTGIFPSPERNPVVFPISEGGAFAALWHMGEFFQSGLSVSLKNIPVRQETIEVCELFDLHPYMLLSRGAYLIAAKHGTAGILARLSDAGIPSALIGFLHSGKKRIVRIDDREMFLTKPQPDALDRLGTPCPHCPVGF